jgi:prevent-host-death family protein
MMDSLSIGEVKSRFSELVSRVSSGERFIIRRREKPLAVLIGTTELERLERTAQLGQKLAFALGQDADLLEQIEAGEVHRTMAAFGLWQDELDLVSLADEIEANRHSQPSRPIKVP